MSTPRNELLTVGSVARLLGVSEDTVRTWADNGTIAVQRTDTGLRLFRRADMERLKKARLAK